MTTKLFYEHIIGEMHNLIWFLVFIYYVIAIDDAQKISRLNAPGVKDLTTLWNAWKRKHTIKGDQGAPAKNLQCLS